jgi:large subunit ribosomal protein L24
MYESKYKVKCRIKKGDEVKVIAGKSCDQTGTVERVDKKKARIYVTGVNIGKRHTKPTSSQSYGGIFDKVLPLDISNVMLVEPKKKETSRIGYKVEEGRKIRYAKKTGALLES